MLKKLLIMIFIVTFSFATITKNSVYTFYTQHNYKNSCKYGLWFLPKNENDPIYLSIVALSCVKVDMINSALRITKYMTQTKLARHNASFIASLYLIKKLLIQFVYDKINISNLSLPKSNNVLSIVFENISHNNYKKLNNKYIIQLKKYKYILYPLKNDNKFKIVIKKYLNNKLISTNMYWN